MDGIQDALDEESEKAWVGCVQDHLMHQSMAVHQGKGREYTGVAWREEHASRWGRGGGRSMSAGGGRRSMLAGEEDDNSDQRVPIRPRFLGCGPPSFREGALFRKPSTLHLHSSPSSTTLRPRTTIPNGLVKSTGSTPFELCDQQHAKPNAVVQQRVSHTDSGPLTPTPTNVTALSAPSSASTTDNS